VSQQLRFGVIGWPLSHTLSPIFQQAALDAMGLDATYMAAATSPDVIEMRLQEAREGNWRGLNVTVPHKIRVAELVDELTPSAKRMGAVNTIDVAGCKLIGDNTDADGFARALTQYGGFDPSGVRAVILGAGGAARAVAWALRDLGVSHLTVANRHPARAETVATAVDGESLATSAFGLSGPELKRAISRATLLVNTTSVGMAGGPAPAGLPVPSSWLKQQLFVCDIVYQPAETPMLTSARNIGCRTQGGLEMLVLQGAASLERWTERRAPLPTMMRAARSALSAPTA